MTNSRIENETQKSCDALPVFHKIYGKTLLRNVTNIIYVGTNDLR